MINYLVTKQQSNKTDTGGRGMSYMMCNRSQCSICFIQAFSGGLQTLSYPYINCVSLSQASEVWVHFCDISSHMRASYIFYWSNCIFPSVTTKDHCFCLHDFFFFFFSFSGCADKDPFLGQNCIFKIFFFFLKWICTNKITGTQNNSFSIYFLLTSFWKAFEALFQTELEANTVIFKIYDILIWF